MNKTITYQTHSGGWAAGQRHYTPPTIVTIKGHISKKPDKLGYYDVRSNDLRWGHTRIFYTDLIKPAQIIGKGIA